MTSESWSRQLIAGAICWLLALEYFVAQVIAQAAWPGYSISREDVSALGVTTCGQFHDPTAGVSTYACSPRHVVMNAGFVLLGLLTILGTILLRRMWPQRRLTTVGLVLVGIGGLGEVLAGFAPGNVNLAIHAIGALLHWVCGSVGILLLGLATWKTRRPTALFSLICGGVGLVGFFLYGNHVYLGLGVGGMERVVAYPLTIWLIVLGVALLLLATRSDQTPDRRAYDADTHRQMRAGEVR